MTPFPCPLPYERWHGEVRAWLQAHPSGPWAVAVSGGADSVALALAVVAQARVKGVQVVLLHFNHGLRSHESDGDEAFVKTLARELNVDVLVDRWAHHSSPDGVTEGQARQARLAFFDRALDSLKGRVLFTGHHADDVAETLLLRLARGSGAAGLSAPRPVQAHARERVFLRPLLHLRKRELCESLRLAHRVWVEDSTNTDTRHPRNAVRHGLVGPWSEATGRDAIAGALRTRQLLQEDNVALEQWVDDLFAGAPPTSDRFDLSPWQDAPLAVLRRALYRWSPTRTLEAPAFDLVLELAKVRKGRVSIPGGWIEAEGAVLLFRSAKQTEAPPLACALEVGQTVPWALDTQLTYRVLAVGAERNAEIRSGGVDPERECWFVPAGRLRVRPWRAGDRYRPLGLGGSIKVQDLWVNHKVPVEKRSLIPVIEAEDGQILWIPGFPPADDYRVIPDSHLLGYLTYSAGTSTFSQQSLTT